MRIRNIFLSGDARQDGRGHRLHHGHREQPGVQAMGAEGDGAPPQAGSGPAPPLHPGPRAPPSGRLQVPHTFYHVFMVEL